MNSVIKIENLTKYYGEVKGIENLSLEVKKGTVFGFIGPNGAGKSTTIRTLLNFIFKTSGEATVFDLDIEKNSKEIRRRVGYLPADINFYDDLTVAKFLEYNAKFYEGDLSERIDYLVKKLELDTSRIIEDLSTGNKRKVAIVVALMHSPELLILDEPTTGLDPLMQNAFFELIEEEKAKGTTIFLSSHILSEVKRVADRIGIIKNGNIIEIGEAGKLTKSNFITVDIKSSEIDKLRKLKNIKITSENSGHLKFIYDGNINDLIANLHECKISALSISEPSLEDVFMHYYE